MCQGWLVGGGARSGVNRNRAVRRYGDTRCGGQPTRRVTLNNNTKFVMDEFYHRADDHARRPEGDPVLPGIFPGVSRSGGDVGAGYRRHTAGDNSGCGRG